MGKRGDKGDQRVKSAGSEQRVQEQGADRMVEGQSIRGDKQTDKLGRLDLATCYHAKTKLIIWKLLEDTSQETFFFVIEQMVCKYSTRIQFVVILIADRILFHI